MLRNILNVSLLHVRNDCIQDVENVGTSFAETQLTNQSVFHDEIKEKESNEREVATPVSCPLQGVLQWAWVAHHHALAFYGRHSNVGGVAERHRGHQGEGALLAVTSSVVEDHQGRLSITLVL